MKKLPNIIQTSQDTPTGVDDLKEDTLESSVLVDRACPQGHVERSLYSNPT